MGERVVVAVHRHDFHFPPDFSGSEVRYTEIRRLHEARSSFSGSGSVENLGSARQHGTRPLVSGYEMTQWEWEWEKSVPAALKAVEHGPFPGPEDICRSLKIVAYNIERGLRLDAILAQWLRCKAKNVDIILLSEADRGMARTRNRHVAREFGEILQFSWAYGVEFVELTKGNRRERWVMGENRESNIGNAILSRYPIANLVNVRLPAFVDHSKQHMARIGSRSALLGDIALGETDITVASAHLESDSSPDQRAAQMEALLEALCARDHGQPIIVGGDMNTSGLDVNRLVRSVIRAPKRVLGVSTRADLEQCEPLFSVARSHGFDYGPSNCDRYTFYDRGFRAHLDWFFTKNVEPQRVKNPEVCQEFSGRRRYSDHLPIGVTIELPSTPEPRFGLARRKKREGVSPII